MNPHMPSVSHVRISLRLEQLIHRTVVDFTGAWPQYVLPHNVMTCCNLFRTLMIKSQQGKCAGDMILSCTLI